MSARRSGPTRRDGRLPRGVEREVAKLLGTLGLRAYGTALWNLVEAGDAPASRTTAAIGAEILRQIDDQARHDPAVAAAGPATIAHLPQVRTPLLARAGVDAAAIFEAAGPRPDVLVLVPSVTTPLRDVGALAAALRIAGARSILAVVTDETAQRAGSADLAQLGADRVVFWPDHCAGASAEHPRFLAQAVHALGPSLVIVSESRVGLQMIARFGLALAPYHRLVCHLGAAALSPEAAGRAARWLRLAVPAATPIVDSAGAAAALRAVRPDAQAIVLDPADRDAVAGILGASFEDRRSPVAARVLPALLAARAGAPPMASAVVGPTAAEPSPIDVTAAIVFHREQDLARAALASLHDMVQSATGRGLRVETIALLDKTDDPTRAIVTAHGTFLDRIEEVAFGDLGLTRNAGAVLARGRYLTFLDGDDLWGDGWLWRAHAVAKTRDVGEPTIWHPVDAFIFHAPDFDYPAAGETADPRVQSYHFLHTPSTAADFEPRDLLIDNLWTANTFAPTHLFRQVPYRANDWSRQHGIEDWRWNLETLGQGIPHGVVADTVHMIRKKETQSLSEASDAKGLLPILS